MTQRQLDEEQQPSKPKAAAPNPKAYGILDAVCCDVQVWEHQEHTRPKEAHSTPTP